MSSSDFKFKANIQHLSPAGERNSTETPQQSQDSTFSASYYTKPHAHAFHSPKPFVRARCGGLGWGLGEGGKGECSKVQQSAAKCSKVSTPKALKHYMGLGFPDNANAARAGRWRALCSFWIRPCCTSVGSTAGVVGMATQKRCLEPRRPKAASIIFWLPFFI